MSHVKRRSFEAGHKPKFLVVIDETSECDRALRFAARRCSRTGASLIMLGIVAEAEEEAAALIEVAAGKARAAAGIEPERAIRVGEKAEAIQALIQEDQDISFLVLAAAVGKDGPGPLVSTISGSASGTFSVPIVIVPGNLDDEEIDALAG
jgi:hypothetical protein